MSSRPSRYLKRDWNHKKPHLAKYSSLPTLQLTPTERPIFQCQQCGFINTLIPMCLWCCWTSDAAHDEFYRSAPRRRPRRLSAPPRVTRTPTPNITLKSPASIPQNGEQYIPIPEGTPYQGTNSTITTPVDNTTPLPPSGVTTPTISTTTTMGKGPQSHTKTPRLRPSIPSFFLPSDVDGPNPSAKSTTTSSMKSINPKSSRFSLFLDFNNNHHNGGRPDSNTHAHETTKKTLNDDEEHTSPILGSSPRTLRRKRRINIVEQAPQLDVPSSAPIAISFDLELKEKEEKDFFQSFDQNSKVIPSSPPYPASKELPQTPPPSSSPILPPPSSPPSSPPVQPPSSPTSIRIGHPNRPYYTAIRKNMSPPASPSSSPPPSRPTSLIGASRPTSLIGPSSSPSRPTSLIIGGGGEGESFPPSSFHHHQRPISLCLGGTVPGMFSPFVIDTHAEEEENASPRSTSTSKNTLPKPKTKKAHEEGTDCRERGSIGFSMSGETELRMALASIQTAESRGGGGGGEFKYRETMSVTTTPTATTPSSTSTHDHAFLQDSRRRRKRGGSMSGVVMRVKAFRKSLKDLIGGSKSAV